jgi:hypothetical protein
MSSGTPGIIVDDMVMFKGLGYNRDSRELAGTTVCAGWKVEVEVIRSDY